MTTGPGERRALLAGEARRHGVALAALFALVATALLAVGLALPRTFEASTTIRVRENPLLKPFSRGGFTDADERVALAREVVLGRSVMDEVLRTGGWLDAAPAPGALERDRLIERIASRTRVSAAGADLVRIAYSDDQPGRALDVTRRFAELYMRDTLAARARQSRDAFDVIDRQVRAQAARDAAEPAQAGATTTTDAGAAGSSPQAGVYRDLLEQREKLRVEMELDATRQGVQFNVVDPAMLPTRPVGLRLSHLMVAGLALGVLVPLALLFARVRLDPRVLSAARIERIAQVPVLASVSPYPTPAVRRRGALRITAVSVVVGLVLLAYAASAWIYRGAGT